MKSRRLRIDAKQKEHPVQIVRPEHFTWTEGEEIDPALVLNDPAFSLYCFDNEHDSVLFVETPDPA